jgi:hypothetical protein
MTEEGVNGLSPAEVARRLESSRRSKVFLPPRLRSRRPASPHNSRTRPRYGRGDGGGRTAPTLIADSRLRGARANRFVAELLPWRPVPSFRPVGGGLCAECGDGRLQRRALADAVLAGQPVLTPTTMPSSPYRRGRGARQASLMSRSPGARPLHPRSVHGLSPQRSPSRHNARRPMLRRHSCRTPSPLSPERRSKPGAVVTRPGPRLGGTC